MSDTKSESGVNLSEITESFDKFAEVTTKAVNELKATSHENSSEFKVKFEKMAAESADLLDKFNKLTDQKTKQDEVILSLEKAVNRRTLAAYPQDPKNLKTDYDVESIKDVDNFLRENYQNHQSYSHWESKKEVLERFDKCLVQNAQFVPMFAQKNARYLKDVVETILPSGGLFVLPFEYLARRITRIFETSPMRQICTVMTINKPQAKMIVDDDQVTDLTVGGEKTTIQISTTPQIAEISFVLSQLSANVRVTDYMIQDTGFDISDWVIGKAGRKMNRQQNTAFLLGESVDTPKGILAYDKWKNQVSAVGNEDNYTQDALEYIGSGASAAFTYDGFVQIQAALLEEYQEAAIWLMHRTSWGAVLQIKDSQQRPIFQLADLLKTGTNRILLGNPVRFAADMPKPTGINVFAFASTPVIYGDFKEGYTIVDRMGISVLRDNITLADNNLVKYLLKTRYDGRLTSYQSLKVLAIQAGV